MARLPITVISAFISIIIIIPKATYGQEEITVPQDKDQWNLEMFESLFPKPVEGQSASEIIVDTLKTFAQKAGIESMGGMISGITGTGVQAPSVRYQLTRIYSNGPDSIVIMMDSEHLNLSMMVMVVHGYSHSKDGKLIPLEEEKKLSPDELREKGIRKMMYSDHLGVSIEEDSKKSFVMLAGEDGVIAFMCEDPECGQDMEVLLNRTNLYLADQFADFDHRKVSGEE